MKARALLRALGAEPASQARKDNRKFQQRGRRPEMDDEETERRWAEVRKLWPTWPDGAPVLPGDTAAGLTKPETVGCVAVYGNGWNLYSSEHNSLDGGDIIDQGGDLYEYHPSRPSDHPSWWDELPEAEIENG